jgi:hypothetical protein
MTPTDTELVPTTDRSVHEGMLAEPSALPASSLEILTRSELDTQMLAARRFPRSFAIFRQNALAMIRQDVETAQACYYVLRRRKADGTFATIEGPSVRLAEIVKSAWGNLRSGGRVLAETDREVIGQGYACDLQTNTSTVKEVRRRIVTAEGRRYSDDMVIVTGNAAIAIAERNAIFGVIPRAMVEPLWRFAKKVVAGDVKTLGESRKRALADCQALGVPPARVCAALGRAGVDDLTVDDLVELRGMLTAIGEGTTTPELAFPPPAPATDETPAASRTAQATETLRRRRTARAPEPSAAADPGEAPPPTPAELADADRQLADEQKKEPSP